MAILDGLEAVSVKQTITANTYGVTAKFSGGRADQGAVCPKLYFSFVVLGAFENALTIRITGFSDESEYSDEFTIVERSYEAADLTKGTEGWIEIPAVDRVYKDIRVAYILDSSSDDVADADTDDLPECPVAKVVDITNYDANTISASFVYGKSDHFATAFRNKYIASDNG